MSGYHDIGGHPAGPVGAHDPAPPDWALRAEALRNAVQRYRGALTLDELRRTFETMGENLYGGLGFYERRTEAFARLLEEKGLATMADIHARMDAIAAARGQVVDHAAKTVVPN